MGMESMATGGMQLIMGAMQGIKGKQQKNDLDAQGRPQYQIPEESYNLAAQGMPGMDAMKQQAASDIQSGFENAKGAASSSSDIMQAATTMNAQRMRGNRELGVQNAQFKAGAMKDLAGLRTKQWDLNVFQKYKEEMSAADAMIGAGMQNVTSGVGGIASGAMSAATMGIG